MTNDQRMIIDSEFSMITGALTHLENLWPRLQFDNEQQAQWVRNHFHPIWVRLNKLYEDTIPQGPAS